MNLNKTPDLRQKKESLSNSRLCLVDSNQRTPTLATTRLRETIERIDENPFELLRFIVTHSGAATQS